MGRKAGVSRALEGIDGVGDAESLVAGSLFFPIWGAHVAGAKGKVVIKPECAGKLVGNNNVDEVVSVLLR